MLLRRGIGKDALRYGEGGVGSWNPAVDGAVKQDLPYLVLTQAVAKRRADVNLQLIQAAQRDEGGQGDTAACPAVEAGATSSPLDPDTRPSA